MVRNIKIAAAVAAVLAAGASHAALPNGQQAQNPSVALYIAGSSAAKNAILTVLEGPTLCNGNYSVFSSTTDTNFFAVSCVPPASTGLSGAGNLFTVWYRAEGGSVTGVLPFVSGSQINQLNLSAASTTPTSNYGTAVGYSVAVTATSTLNGVDDSFPNTFKAPVQLGISDVEPTALVKSNYPSAYVTSVYGSASAAQLGQLQKQAIFDQVFGIFVNATTAAGFTTAQGTEDGVAVGPNYASGLSISSQVIANILDGKLKDWSKVPDNTGKAVTSGSSPITVINREAGSGSRTATDIFFTGDSCLTSTTSAKKNNIQETGGTDYFSTSDVLSAANTTPGSITYATIDQSGGSFPNLTLVAIDGIQPSNLTAAAGAYGDWFEAFAITGAATPTSGDAATLEQALVTAFQDINNNSFGQADLLANPNVVQTYGAALPISGTNGTSGAVNGAKTIYTNPLTRGGVSCSVPVDTLTQ